MGATYFKFNISREFTKTRNLNSYTIARCRTLVLGKLTIVFLKILDMPFA